MKTYSTFVQEFIQVMDNSLRTTIKKTAAKLFLKYGLRSVSIDDICNELRISKKTFYTHFSQKEELIESVLMEHNEKQLKKQDVKFNPCRNTGNAIDLIMEVSSFHSSRKNDQFVNFFYDLNKYYPEIHKRMTHHNQEHIREIIRLNIRTGIDENLFRSDFDMDIMVRFLALQFMTLIDLSPKDIGKSSLRRGMAFVVDLYLRVLCNRVGMDYYEQLQSKKMADNQVDEEPLMDEELDQILENMLGDEDLKQVVMNHIIKQ